MNNHRYGSVQGTWGRFSIDEYSHALHLLRGEPCDCEGVRSERGKVRFFPYSGNGDSLLVNPDDIDNQSEAPSPELQAILSGSSPIS